MPGATADAAPLRLRPVALGAALSVASGLLRQLLSVKQQKELEVYALIRLFRIEHLQDDPLHIQHTAHPVFDIGDRC